MKFTLDVLGIFLKVVIKVNKVTFAPLVVSILFILLTSWLAHLGRKLVRSTVKESILRSMLEEAIAAAELCGCCFELIVVSEHFGVMTYAIFLFVLTIWWSKNWGEATACPYNHFEDTIEGKSDVRKMLLKIWAELTGGLVVYNYVMMYWSLEIIEPHKNMVMEECSADLQVPVLYGAMLEGVGTCLCRLASKTLGDLNPKYATAIDSFIATSLVVAAFDYTGGYFNPVLATALKAGCMNHTLLEHALVYWVGAFVGSAVSVYLYKLPAIQNWVKTPEANGGESIWADKED